MLTRRHCIAGSIALAATLPGRVSGAGWPDRMVRVIVPNSPGGGADILARQLADGMQELLGQRYLVENKPDNTGIIGADTVARSPPDGYTLLASTNALYQNPAILKSIPFDAVKDFAGVTMLAQAPVILVVHKEVPARDLNELIAYAKTKPGQLTYASGGIGASTHIAGVLLNLSAGTELVHIPYRSSGSALNDLLGGHVTMQFGGISSAKGLVENGTLRAIALTGASRDPSMPTVPTFKELGYDVDILSLWSIHAPAGTPKDIRERLRAMYVEVMKRPAVRQRLAELGYQPVGSTPDEHDAETRRLVALWIELSKKVKLSIE